MKNTITASLKGLTAFLLACACILGALSATAAEPEALTSSADESFGLDMEVKKNTDNSSLIDVIIKVKDIHQELDAIEFTLNFDKQLVAGCITDIGPSMDAFMTVKPMYTFVVSGMEIPVSRYEQICTYNGEKGAYVCRFLDTLQYPNKKPGEVYHGLRQDGDLIITIQFKILDGVAKDGEFAFSATNVKGTTRGTLVSVKGSSAYASIGTPLQHVHNWSDATCTSPKTCKSCGLTEGAAKGHTDTNGDYLCDLCNLNLSQAGESTDPIPDTSDISVAPLMIMLMVAALSVVALHLNKKRLF